jgi:hypothetical protein
MRNRHVGAFVVRVERLSGSDAHSLIDRIAQDIAEQQEAKARYLNTAS